MSSFPLSIRRVVIRDLSGLPGIGEPMARALARNPYVESSDCIAKICGFCDQVEAGGEYVFPLHVKSPMGEIAVLAGSGLCVDPKYRRSGLGMDLPELRWRYAPCKVALGAALSQMAVPVHQLLDYNVFLLPRNIMLWRSRALVETRLRGFAEKCVSFLVDCGIALYARLLGAVRSCRLAGFKIEEVQADDEEAVNAVADLVAADGASFAEVHDARWIRWHMTESFSKDGPLRLFVARKKGDVVGFYMTKRRFHEQASHRGFRNVWLGSVVEWQARPELCGKLGWLLVDGALRLKKDGVDAVEVSTADRALNGFFRRLGWRQVGESNFVVKAGEGSPLFGNEDMSKIENWRLRPAMGDAGLS